jgi:hypothetical protein
MFIAKGGKKIGEQQLDHNEEIEVMELTVQELLQVIEERGIVQSMHLSTIFYALRYLDKINYI